MEPGHFAGLSEGLALHVVAEEIWDGMGHWLFCHPIFRF